MRVCTSSRTPAGGHTTKRRRSGPNSSPAPVPPPAFPLEQAWGTRHGPTTLASYTLAHQGGMGRFEAEGFIRSHTVGFGAATNGYIAIAGAIRCLGGMTISVDKTLTVLDGQGPGAMVYTTEFHYHVQADGRGPVVRYDSPHPHRPYNHVHRFDFLETWDAFPIVPIHEIDDVPTLSDVIEEVRDLYWDNEF